VNIRKLLLIFLLSLFLIPTGIRAEIAIPADTSKLEIRLPNPKNITEYRKQKAFKYSRGNGKINYLRLLPLWLQKALFRFLRLVFTSGSAELYLGILLVIAVIAIVLRANDINPIALFRRKNRNIQPLYDTGNENISGMDFPVLIDQAVKQNNYRLAIRFQYLQLLFMLAGLGEIDLREGKTNREYIQEIKNTETRDVFRNLVYGFEFVWYGEFLPDEKQYSQLSSAFVTFSKSMQI
jgi:hypothetical protein